MTRNGNRKLRYATYSRCSSDDQAHKDFSTIQVQMELNEQYVRDADGILAGQYKDEGVSGTSLKRPGWISLLADARAGKFDVVVVTYMSRLGRGRMFGVASYLLEEEKVQVHTVKEKFTKDMSGYVNQEMTQFVDGMYVEQVRMWTKTKMEAMVKAGFHCGGYPPFGYDKVEVTEFTSLRKPDKAPPKRLVPNLSEAPIVRQAFSLYAEQGSLADVRNYLDSVTSRRWSTTTTKSLLTNEVFRGAQVFGQWRNDAAHEAIVTQEIWQAVQERLGVSASRYAVRTEDEYTYYLRGRVVCPHCGCPATHASQRGHGGKNHYYVCRNANRHGDCPVKRINADKLHASVLGFVRHASEHWTVMRKLISQSGGWATADESQVALRGQLGKQKQAVEMRIANYVKVIGEGRFSPAIVSALEKAEAERDTLIEKLEQADREIGAATFKRPTTEQVQEAWQQICAVWDVLGEEERTDLMGSLVQRVEMTDKTNVTLELLPIPASHSERFELNSRMGAPAVAIYTGSPVNPSTYGATIFVPSGGQLRKHIPRPAQQAKNRQAELTLE